MNKSFESQTTACEVYSRFPTEHDAATYPDLFRSFNIFSKSFKIFKFCQNPEFFKLHPKFFVCVIHLNQTDKVQRKQSEAAIAEVEIILLHFVFLSHKDPCLDHHISDIELLYIIYSNHF